jgi:hypothetical protein
MYTQLTYTIAKQHHAELVQAAGRARLVADSGTGCVKSQSTTAFNRFRVRITSVLAQATPGTRGTI